MNKDARYTIVAHLEALMRDGSIKPEVVPSLIRFIDNATSEKNEDLIKTLVQKIQDWEDTMGEDDKSLYTLGIRQAVDVLRGDSPTHAKEYKPLDEEDFRPKEETKDF
jgi:hypothetical protein